MAASRKSFFSTLPGFVTGLAGLVSAAVAAVGLGVQQGWIGGSGSEPSADELRTDGRAALSRENQEQGRADEEPAFAVEPTSVSFGPVGSRDASVKVRNTGDVDLRLGTPTITGDDPDRFRVSEGTCNGVVDPGRSCELDVTFTPKTGTFSAVLVVEAEEGGKAHEVPLQARAVL